MRAGSDDMMDLMSLTHILYAIFDEVFRLEDYLMQ